VTTASRYVYAIGRPFDPAGLGDLAGIDGARIGLTAHRDLVAVVSAAPPDEAALRSRLERLDELAVVAQAHHAVVAEVAHRTVVAPFRLATIYQDQRRVDELLRDRYDNFRATLDRLAGMVELGVKIYLERPPPVPVASSGSGRAYLRQLGQRHQRRDDEWRAATAAAGRVDTTLSAYVLDRNHHRPQPAGLPGSTGHNLLNVAYLVPVTRAAEFAELARRVTAGEPALRAEVTGPWAPYSFTGPGLS
jgi:hypothetical protein